MHVLNFPFCLRDSFGSSFSQSLLCIEADPDLGVPYGNDLQIPGVFGKWYLYVV